MQRDILNSQRAKTIVAQGLWLTTIVKPSRGLAYLTLRWMQELAHTTEYLPPPGVVSDLGLLLLGPSILTSTSVIPAPILGVDDALGADRTPSPRDDEVGDLPPGQASDLVRQYEDIVTCKWHYDATLERAGDAVRHYPRDEVGRGIAFVLNQVQSRLGWRGLRIPPGTLKVSRPTQLQELLDLGRATLETEGLAPELVSAYEEILVSMKHAPRALGQEDLFELEHKTALAEFGQRLALRQLLVTADQYTKALGQQRLSPSGRRPLVSSRVREEDAYPVGGFSSISNRGTMESLLQSELAYMDSSPQTRPDLFDIKYVRDELLYYARDENQFLRQHLAYTFCFWPNLKLARHKDPSLPYQRIIHLLALVAAGIEALIDVLTKDSLVFHLVFLTPPPSPTSTSPAARPGQVSPLGQEEKLLEMRFREQIANGTVVIHQETGEALEVFLRTLAQRYDCHVIHLDLGGHPPSAQHAGFWTTRVDITHPQPWIGRDDLPLRPALFQEDEERFGVGGEAGSAVGPEVEAKDSLAWPQALRTLMSYWI